jgi:hypothetical protein
MSAPDVPIDLTGAVVVGVEWPPRGFRMLLDGEAADGPSVAGARLTFEAVVNQYPLRGFLSEKRSLRRRTTPSRGAGPSPSPTTRATRTRSGCPPN